MGAGSASLDLAADLWPAIDDRDNVLEVMADRNITCAATVEGFELSSDEVHGSNKANRVVGNGNSVG